MEWNQLLDDARQPERSQAALAEICRRFTGLVKKTAGQSHLRPIQEEALAEGWLAVVRAAGSYDRTLGVPFPGYVESRVRYAVWNLFKRERRRWERECLVIDRKEDDDRESPLALLIAPEDVAGCVERSWEREQLASALQKIPARQRLAVTRTLLRQERLALLAAELGISVQAVHHLRKKGLAGLKKELAGMYPGEGR